MIRRIYKNSRDPMPNKLNVLPPGLGLRIQAGLDLHEGGIRVLDPDIGFFLRV